MIEKCNRPAAILDKMPAPLGSSGIYKEYADWRKVHTG